MAFRNDPALAAVPTAGSGQSVSVGWRTKVGDAVLWDGTDNAALEAFLNDDTLVLVSQDLYRKELSGSLTPIPRPTETVVVVRPQAGEWYLVDEQTFVTEFAMHVNVPTMKVDATAAKQAEANADALKNENDATPATMAPVKKQAVKK